MALAAHASGPHAGSAHACSPVLMHFVADAHFVATASPATLERHALVERRARLCGLHARLDERYVGAHYAMMAVYRAFGIGLVATYDALIADAETEVLRREAGARPPTRPPVIRFRIPEDLRASVR